MLTRSHRIFSIAIVELGLIATDTFLINPTSNIILLLATGVGASLPDIDEYNSTTSRKSPINFSLFLRHRGITHSLFGWLAFSIILYFCMNHFFPITLSMSKPPNYWKSIWLGLVIGYLLHLIEDSFSRQGVAWLPHFFKKKHRGKFLHYKVGGPFERAIIFLAAIGITLMSIYWLLIIIRLPHI